MTARGFNLGIWDAREKAAGFVDVGDSGLNYRDFRSKHGVSEFNVHDPAPIDTYKDMAEKDPEIKKALQLFLDQQSWSLAEAAKSTPEEIEDRGRLSRDSLTQLAQYKFEEARAAGKASEEGWPDPRDFNAMGNFLHQAEIPGVNRPPLTDEEIAQNMHEMFVAHASDSMSQWENKNWWHKVGARSAQTGGDVLAFLATRRLLSPIGKIGGAAEKVAERGVLARAASEAITNASATSLLQLAGMAGGAREEFDPLQAAIDAASGAGAATAGDIVLGKFMQSAAKKMFAEGVAAGGAKNLEEYLARVGAGRVRAAIVAKTTADVVKMHLGVGGSNLITYAALQKLGDAIRHYNDAPAAGDDKESLAEKAAYTSLDLLITGLLGAAEHAGRSPGSIDRASARKFFEQATEAERKARISVGLNPDPGAPGKGMTLREAMAEEPGGASQESPQLPGEPPREPPSSPEVEPTPPAPQGPPPPAAPEVTSPEPPARNTQNPQKQLGEGAPEAPPQAPVEAPAPSTPAATAPAPERTAELKEGRAKPAKAAKNLIFSQLYPAKGRDEREANDYVDNALRDKDPMTVQAMSMLYEIDALRAKRGYEPGEANYENTTPALKEAFVLGHGIANVLRQREMADQADVRNDMTGFLKSIMETGREVIDAAANEKLPGAKTQAAKAPKKGKRVEPPEWLGKKEEPKAAKPAPAITKITPDAETKARIEDTNRRMSELREGTAKSLPAPKTRSFKELYGTPGKERSEIHYNFIEELERNKDPLVTRAVAALNDFEKLRAERGYAENEINSGNAKAGSPLMNAKNQASGLAGGLSRLGRTLMAKERGYEGKRARDETDVQKERGDVAKDVEALEKTLAAARAEKPKAAPKPEPKKEEKPTKPGHDVFRDEEGNVIASGPRAVMGQGGKPSYTRFSVKDVSETEVKPGEEEKLGPDRYYKIDEKTGKKTLVVVKTESSNVIPPGISPTSADAVLAKFIRGKMEETRARDTETHYVGEPFESLEEEFKALTERQYFTQDQGKTTSKPGHPRYNDFRFAASSSHVRELKRAEHARRLRELIEGGLTHQHDYVLRLTKNGAPAGTIRWTGIAKEPGTSIVLASGFKKISDKPESVRPGSAAEAMDNYVKRLKKHKADAAKKTGPELMHAGLMIPMPSEAERKVIEEQAEKDIAKFFGQPLAKGVLGLGKLLGMGADAVKGGHGSTTWALTIPEGMRHGLGILRDPKVVRMDEDKERKVIAALREIEKLSSILDKLSKMPGGDYAMRDAFDVLGGEPPSELSVAEPGGRRQPKSKEFKPPPERAGLKPAQQYYSPDLARGISKVIRRLRELFDDAGKRLADLGVMAEEIRENTITDPVTGIQKTQITAHYRTDPPAPRAGKVIGGVNFYKGRYAPHTTAHGRAFIEHGRQMSVMGAPIFDPRLIREGRASWMKHREYTTEQWARIGGIRDIRAVLPVLRNQLRTAALSEMFAQAKGDNSLVTDQEPIDESARRQAVKDTKQEIKDHEKWMTKNRIKVHFGLPSPPDLIRRRARVEKAIIDWEKILDAEGLPEHGLPPGWDPKDGASEILLDIQKRLRRMRTKIWPASNVERPESEADPRTRAANQQLKTLRERLYALEQQERAWIKLEGSEWGPLTDNGKTTRWIRADVFNDVATFDEQSRGWRRVFDATLALIKSASTSENPSGHFGNMLGNFALNWIAGVSALPTGWVHYMHSLIQLVRHGQGKETEPTAKEFAELGGLLMDPITQEMMRELPDGLIESMQKAWDDKFGAGTGAVGALGNGMLSVLNAVHWLKNHRSKLNPLKYMHEAYGIEDQWAAYALYRALRTGKGSSRAPMSKEAAFDIVEQHYNYRRISPVVRGYFGRRGLFPFASWMWKQIGAIPQRAMMRSISHGIVDLPASLLSKLYPKPYQRVAKTAYATAFSVGLTAGKVMLLHILLAIAAASLAGLTDEEYDEARKNAARTRGWRRFFQLPVWVDRKNPDKMQRVKFWDTTNIFPWAQISRLWQMAPNPNDGMLHWLARQSPMGGPILDYITGTDYYGKAMTDKQRAWALLGRPFIPRAILNFTDKKWRDADTMAVVDNVARSFGVKIGAGDRDKFLDAMTYEAAREGVDLEWMKSRHPLTAEGHAMEADFQRRKLIRLIREGKFKALMGKYIPDWKLDMLGITREQLGLEDE